MTKHVIGYFCPTGYREEPQRDTFTPIVQNSGRMGDPEAPLTDKDKIVFIGLGINGYDTDH